MTKHKLLIQQYLKQAIVEATCILDGKLFVMIEMELEKKTKFVQATTENSPTGYSGATTLSPNGDSFMFVETSFTNSGENVFCTFERTGNIQISSITFYYNRFSTPVVNLRSMGRFRIQVL